MRILYGVAGEGMGHATRSSVLARHLLARGHQVCAVTSGRAYDFLRRRLPDVREIDGLELRYADGAMDLPGSIAANATRMPAALARNAAVFSALERFAPDAVVSDFESLAYLYGRTHGVPVLSVDNLQMIARCEHPPWLLGDFQSDQGTAAAFVAAKLPHCAHYVVTTFFYPPVRPACAPSTTLVPPIIRDAIVRARPTDASHVLVYQTAVGDSRLLDALNAHPAQRFVVYGLRRDATVGNCTLRSFSDEGFVRDLASARGVIANGGMSLMGEAVYLRKPMLSVPVRRHFEQGMNARYLAGLGYGATADRFDAGIVGSFLAHLPAFARRLREIPPQEGNRVLFDVVDQVLAGLSRGSRSP